MSEPRPATLDALLEFVKESRGFDFTGYKRSSVERRVAKRMMEVGVAPGLRRLHRLPRAASGGVRRALQHDPDQRHRVLPRSPDVGAPRRATIIPQLLAARSADAPLRVWCAGCASGEEPYTVAMVLARVLGERPFRERVKIYATDVDEDGSRSGAPRRLPARARSRTCRPTRSSASSSAPISATCSARTSAAA